MSITKFTPQMGLMRTLTALLVAQGVAHFGGAQAQASPILSIKLEQVAVEPGNHDVRIRTEIRNVSDREVQVLTAAPEMDFAVTVTRPDRRPAPLTELGRKLRSVLPNGSHVLVTIPPHESISRTWNLSDSIDFSMRGQYRITVSRHFESSNETVVSNPITVEIR